MIESLCLASLVLVVIVRTRSSWRKPAWWATTFAAISIGTYGIFAASPAVMDGLLGGRNLLTLLRDISAVAAMWFFHNALAIARGRPERKLPAWLLCVALTSFAIPFLLIPQPGPTSPHFVLDRLDEFTVWLFAAVYISIMGGLAARAITFLYRDLSVMTGLYVLGLSLMLVGSVVEFAYLCIAHFAPPDASFRESFYFAAEVPFFGGILLAVLGFIWVLGRRAFWKSLALWTVQVDGRAHYADYRTQVLMHAQAGGWSSRQIALDSAVNIRDRLKMGTQTLSRTETLVFSAVERLLSGRLEGAAR
jgi:hypothetical protein